MDTTKNCRLQSWTLYKSADCRRISTTILCVSFTNSATVVRLKQVQLCNRLIDQSADNITGLKCAKKCLILKYKYIQNPWFYQIMAVVLEVVVFQYLFNIAFGDNYYIFWHFLLTLLLKNTRMSIKKKTNKHTNKQKTTLVFCYFGSVGKEQTNIFPPPPPPPRP